MSKILRSHDIGGGKVLNINEGSFIESVADSKYFLSITYKGKIYQPPLSASNDYEEILKRFNFSIKSNEWWAKSVRDNYFETNEYDEKIAGTFEGDFFEYIGLFSISEFGTENNYTLLKLNFKPDTLFPKRNIFLKKYNFPINGVYLYPNCEVLLNEPNFIFRFKNKNNNIELFRSNGSQIQLLMLYTYLNSYHDQKEMFYY